MRHVFESQSDISVAVIGDVMLDCYLSGIVDRISPEAPVPVLQAKSQRDVPGGAANVAANVASLGLKVRLVGVVGNDHDRDVLMLALRERGIEDSLIVADATRRTTRKLRIIGGSQQMVRIDQEDTQPLSPSTEADCIAAAARALAGATIAIVSDYGKGVCTPRLLDEVFRLAADAGIKVIVDPKQRNLSAYRGAAILTPNRKELADATKHRCESDDDLEEAVISAQHACQCDILVTRSEKGMSYFPLTGAPHHFPTAAQDVFDVSGAGDTVVAGLAAGLAAGMPIYDSIRIANHAAGIVISKLGTASVTLDELEAAIAAEDDVPDVVDGRLLEREEAAILRRVWAQQHLTVGFANGCFDLLHAGHITLIREAAAHCDRLIVAINSDDSIRRLKGASRPIQDERARAAVVGAIKGVAAVAVFSEDTPLGLITALQPDLIVKGADYTVETVVGAQLVQARGGRVLLVDIIAGESTSRLVTLAQSAASM